MKLFYFILGAFSLLMGGYLFINDFNFDNISFSNYLITTLVILLTSCLVVGCVAWLIAMKRKHYHKDVMTIRQYYDYKSAR